MRCTKKNTLPVQEQNLGDFLLSFCICFCQVTAKNDFTDESFDSSWHYLNHIEKHSRTSGTAYGHDDYVFHNELLQSQVLYSTTYSLLYIILIITHEIILTLG